MRAPALLLLFKVALVLWGLLWFHTLFSIICFRFCEKCLWDFVGDYMESVDYFGSMAISTILVLPVHHSRSVFGAQLT